MKDFFKKDSLVVNKEVEIKINKKEVENFKFTELLLNWLIKIPIYLVIILLPLFFYLQDSSFFELNKQILLVILTGISILAWIGKMAWKNEIGFKKSFLLVSVMVFLFIYGLSAIFSDYFEQSMWGYFGGESQSFISILFLVIFFILIFNNTKNYQEVSGLILAFLLSGLVLVILGILQFFEIYLLPFDFTQSFSFNLVGSIYVYSIYIGLIFLVTVVLFLSNMSKLIKIFLVGLSCLSFFLLIAINFKIVWLVLILGLSLILIVTILMEGNRPSRLRILPMIFLALALVFVLKSKPIFNKELPIELFLEHKIVREISLKSLKNNSMLGDGPAMFENVYKKHRPNNLENFSDINSNQTTSFFGTVATTTGILGITSFLFLIISGIVLMSREIFKTINNAKSQIEKNPLNYLNISIGLGWLFLTAFLFLYSANITILMLWWLFLAFLAIISFLNKKEDYQKEITTISSGPRASFLLSFSFILVVIGLISVIYLHSQKYVAAIYFNQAMAFSVEQNKTQEIADKIADAVALDSNRDFYYRDLAAVYLVLAKEKITEKGLENLNPEESNYISTKFKDALQLLQQAKDLNPSSSVNYFSLANLYQEFIIIQKDFADKALENYEKAIELDPKNLELYKAVANVKITLADLDAAENVQKQQQKSIEISIKAQEFLASAEEYANKALEINPKYLAGNLLLVVVYEKRGDLNKAIEKSKQNLEFYPNYPELHMDLARIYYQQANYDEAENHLIIALRMNNQYSNARYLLGLVLDKKGQKDKALEEFEKIKEYNPENELLDKIISNLKNRKEALEDLDNDSEAKMKEINSEDIIQKEAKEQNLMEEELLEPEDAEETDFKEEIIG